MVIRYNGESLELTPDNCIIVAYQNDILNGVYIDVSEDDYAFISAHTEGYDGVEKELFDQGVGYVPMGEIDNYGEAPHLFVMNSVARLIVAEAEEIIGC